MSPRIAQDARASAPRAGRSGGRSIGLDRQMFSKYCSINAEDLAKDGATSSSRLSGRMVSTFGDGVALVALTLRLQADGAHPYEVGLLLAAGVVPQLLLARPIGRLVDTHDSRRLLVSGRLVEVAATIPLIFLHSIVPIMALVAVLGAASSMTGATWSALIPRVVGEDSPRRGGLDPAVPERPRPRRGPGGRRICWPGRSAPACRSPSTLPSFVVVTVAAALVRTRRVPEPDPGRRRTSAGSGADSPSSGPIGVLAPLLVGRGPRRPPRRHGRRRAGVPRPRDPPCRRRLVRRDRGLLDGWAWSEEPSGPASVADRTRTGARHHRRNSPRVRRGGRLRRSRRQCGSSSRSRCSAGSGTATPGTCLSTLLISRTPDSARGRVSASRQRDLRRRPGHARCCSAALVAIVLSPREMYAIGGLLGLAAAGVLAVTHASPDAAAGPRRPAESVPAG